MVAELSALQQIVTALTGLDGLPAVVVEALVTTAYTSLGGFRISFLTDVIQGFIVVVIIVLAVIAIGATTHVDRALVQSSGFLAPSLLGWQLIYILPVAILTNDFFISGFWLRTFASRTDRDLVIGTSVATVGVTLILTLVGVTGLLAAWTGAWPGDPPQSGSIALFLLLGNLPNWTVGIVLCMTVALSTAAFDSFQSAMVSTGSNDLFRNKLNIWVIRGSVALVIVPVIVVALQSPSILQIYLISDLVSAAAVPVLVIGLWDRAHWWRGCDFVVGSLGGLLTVFLFGTVYYGNARQGAYLLLLENGLYEDDWSAFGAFVAAPVGALLWGFASLAVRLAVRRVYCWRTGSRFDALDRPVDVGRGGVDEEIDTEGETKAGRFF
jgi:Na+/proline symporter